MQNKINKSLVGKLGIAAAVGLIGSNLLTPLSYPVFATDEWNTATYSSGDDGYTISYDGKSYTVALSDQPGTYYYWGNNYPTTDTEHGGNNKNIGMGETNNNIRGGSGDNASNGFRPNPTNYDERKGPCDDGYHVPSRGEWNAIVTAWCHLDTNTCTESDLQHASDWTSENGMIKITSNSTLVSAFKISFNMGNGIYWSSSPDFTNNRYAWYFNVGNMDIIPSNAQRYGNARVRCVKNSTSAGGSSSEQGSSSSSSALTWVDVESGSLAGTLTDMLLSFIMPEHNVYLYAIAEANTYHVAYSGNQATSGTMENSTFTYDTAGTLRANAFERAGYTFSGWNTQADNSGTGYADGASVLNLTVEDGGTVNMYAQWNVDGYSIAYTLHNGTVDPANPTTYTVESAAFTLNNPTRDNSVFAGWSGTDIGGLSNEVTIANGSIGNRTYEANWSCAPGYHDGGSDNCEANTYSGSVVYNDGTHGSAESIVFTYDQYTTLPNPSQSGYDFAGWTITGMSGGVEHYIGETTTTESAYSGAMTTQFKNLTTDEGYTDITFTAKWTPKTDTKYVVNYYVKDLGADTYTLRETYTGSATTDTDIVFSTEQARYSFTGFNYSGGYENEGDTTRPEGLGATTGNVDKYGTTVINLYYDRISSAVSLNGANISSFSGAGNYEYGAEVTVDVTPKTGYHFVRWERRNSDWSIITN